MLSIIDGNIFRFILNSSRDPDKIMITIHNLLLPTRRTVMGKIHLYFILYTTLFWLSHERIIQIYQNQTESYIQNFVKQ